MGDGGHYNDELRARIGPNLDRLTPPPVGLRDYLTILRRRRVVVVVVVASAMAASLALSAVAPSIYAATATIAVRQPDQAFAQPVQNTPQNAQDRDRRIQTIVSQLKLDDFRQRVVSSIRPRPDVDSISVTAADNADIIRVTARSKAPRSAQEVANAYAKAFVDQERAEGAQALTQQSKDLRTRADSINRQLGTVDAQLTDAEKSGGGLEALKAQQGTLAAQYQDFTSRADQLDVNARLVVASGSKVEEAHVPTSPVSPRPLRDLLLALVFGLLAGVGLAFLIDLLDDRLKTLPEIQAAASGVPILATIPRSSELGAGAARLPTDARPDSVVAEAFRGLGVTLRLLSLDQDLKTVLVTSPMPEEGKTTIVANLAVALARAGRRTLVVNCDLRRPRLHEEFGVLKGSEPGLVDVLAGDVPLASALIEVPTSGGHSVWFLRFAEPLRDPAEVFSSPRLGRAFESLRSEFDVVLIDSAPVIPVSDSLPLVKLVDSVILVAAYRSTGRAVMTKAVEHIERAGARQLGLVVTKVTADARADGYSIYGYGEYGEYSVPSSRRPWRRPKPAADSTMSNGVGSSVAAETEPAVGNGTGERVVSRQADPEDSTAGVRWR